MSAIGKTGASTLAEREESFAFSRQILHEYCTKDVTGPELAEKYGLSHSTIYRRLQDARDRERA